MSLRKLDFADPPVFVGTNKITVSAFVILDVSAKERRQGIVMGTGRMQACTPVTWLRDGNIEAQLLLRVNGGFRGVDLSHLTRL